eukprot:2717510-Rhodomonas_salina.1
MSYAMSDMGIFHRLPSLPSRTLAMRCPGQAHTQTGSLASLGVTEDDDNSNSNNNNNNNNTKNKNDITTNNNGIINNNNINNSTQ